MKANWIYCFFFICLLAGCQTGPTNTVTQISTIDALLAGAYDGVIPCSVLVQYGDLGIGTFDKLDGEMVILDRAVYQVLASGTINQVGPNSTTPFASVCEFKADTTCPVPAGTNFETLKTLLDQAVPNQNVFCAFKLHGHFLTLKTRSVPAQEKPYPALADVVETQTVFNLENVQGTLLGFRCPPFVQGINVPGYHLHFLSDDTTLGGHILDFDLAQTTCEIDLLDKFYMILPENGQGLETLDLKQDRSQELEKVEQ